MRIVLGFLLLGMVGWPAARAADDAVSQHSPLDEVLVIATTPLPGTAIDADKVPSNVQSLRASDLRRGGAAGLAGALNGQLGSIHINDTVADPFQSDVLYRGFEASPVLGTPQGLAVYQNGVRINEAFGDAVNWDLIPDIAVNRIDVVSANPVYGLNALGGAADVAMKNGFDYQGADAELSGGAYGRREGSAEYGIHRGYLGFYSAARLLDQDGWRYFARDKVRQFYTSLSARNDNGSLDLSYTHADNKLHGPGAAPVQSLALTTENVFTGPQANLNRLDFVTLNGSYRVGSDMSLQGVLYYRNYRQAVSNGNTTNYTACTTPQSAGFLCQSDGQTRLLGAAGQALPDISEGGAIPIGENDFESIHNIGHGGSLQLHDTSSIAGHGNQLTMGATLDTAGVDFSSGAELGIINPALMVLPSALIVDTPEGTGFSATPVILRATNRYYGFFLTDTFDVSPALAVTASGRYNVAQIDLYDRRGTNLDGRNRYTHFNPALGATHKLTRSATVYAGYSMTNRTPTASEIECSDPLLPCVLPSSLAGDPPGLKQVIARTYELGLRGKISFAGAGAGGGTGTTAGTGASATAGNGMGGVLGWNIGLFRTNLADDIYAIATSISEGFFQNIGSTRRQGVEAGLNYRWNGGAAYLSYSYVDATFESALTLYSPQSPAADAGGEIQVRSGDRLPLIPQHRVKVGADYNLLPNWSVGGTFVFASSQYYRGDESNQNPQLPGFHVLGLHSSLQLGHHSQLFLSVDNVFNERYSTYGLFADPTGVGAPGVPPGAGSNGPGVDNRFQSPAAPRSVFGGIRITF